MSDIGLIMNTLLGFLLVGALVVGWRLEGRLKALRASHQGFTAAVQDLDRAAARAEHGLADLRAATDEAAETLAARIERAAALAQRLERLTADAVGAEARLAAAPRSTPSRESALQRFSERYGAPKVTAEPSPLAQAAARHDLILEDEPQAPARPPAERLAANERLERLRALARPRPDPARVESIRADPHRPRARIDDELFDAPAPRRMAAGGAR